ncbi:OLC1v1025852C1 [Oldenlandia corymbosa var. corymbosa]|uniref:OLC1v1025852C1 n=1 Tax=Oldenlandia corymbosa var. corymbosa TaxID=529605 RepID=A0AAV1C6C6_OLDCO|nr:OLC1v1025852C1 [Oldenlandia corymbosa var. corymbosa]
MNPPPPFPPYYYHQPPPPFNSLPPPAAIPPPPPPLPASHLQLLPETAAPDLPTALSALASLLRLTETTLNSLSPYLPTPNPSALIPCPFNPNHRLPHSSLFSHYLSCPSSFAPISDPQSLLDPLHYPQALHSTPTKSSRPILLNPTSPDLRFSLKYFMNVPQNFFYFNCPAAVIVDPFNTNGSSSPMFSLPGKLSAECANFRSDGDSDEKISLLESIRMFPSEIWAVRYETEGWVDYPSSYSCRLLRSILSFFNSDLSGVLTWVIENSPRYGVVIDSTMRDHIVLLFKLCLKAIIREAISFSGVLSDERADSEMGLGEKRFDCPVLMKAMMWLGSQLSVLYREVSGKTFAINMLKHCVIDSAMRTSCFPVVEIAKDSSDSRELDANSEGTSANSGKEVLRRMMHESVQKSKIFVNQVAASVAALYERLSLEEKIKSLRDTRQLTAHQRVVEHECILNNANEELQKRSNYRPIIDHDGILSKRRQNQEPNRTKTKEELLAEERDYKRRRMSYRGKKIKRSTTQSPSEHSAPF